MKLHVQMKFQNLQRKTYLSDQIGRCNLNRSAELSIRASCPVTYHGGVRGGRETCPPLPSTIHDSANLPCIDCYHYSLHVQWRSKSRIVQILLIELHGISTSHRRSVLSHVLSPPLPAWCSSSRGGWVWPGTIQNTHRPMKKKRSTQGIRLKELIINRRGL